MRRETSSKGDLAHPDRINSDFDDGPRGPSSTPTSVAMRQDPMIATTSRPLPDALKIGGMVFAGALLAQLLSVAVWAPYPKAHMIWMPGAVLLCALLLTPPARWPVCLLGALLGVVAVSLFRVPVRDVLLTVGGIFVLVTATAWLLLRFRSAQPPLEDFAQIGRFVLLACVLLPAASAWWVVTISNGNQLQPYIGSWLNVSLAHSLGYVLVVPAVISGIAAATQPERRNQFTVANLATAAFLIGMLWLVWNVSWDNEVVIPLLLLVPIPLLVWALAVFGIAGACGAMLIVALLCMRMSVRGDGPFVAANLADTVLSVQFWTIGTAISLLFLAAMAEQRMSSRLMLKRAYQQLSKVTGRMLVVQEEERTRIARDLHDDINQSLAAVSIHLSSVKREMEPAERELISGVQEQLLSISNDIRDISHELHPSILRFTGLASALGAFCEKHNARGSLQLKCSISNLAPLSEQQELGVFRIVQEAVNNIDKHARARNAHILLQRSEKELLLVIEDDGVGYSPNLRHASPPGLGIISMEERARALDGRFDICRQMQGGTRVEVRFPISMLPSEKR